MPGRRARRLRLPPSSASLVSPSETPRSRSLDFGGGGGGQTTTDESSSAEENAATSPIVVEKLEVLVVERLPVEDLQNGLLVERKGSTSREGTPGKKMGPKKRFVAKLRTLMGR